NRLVDMLPEEHRQKAYELCKQIDPTDHKAIILYGTQAQSKLLHFSQTMLEHVQNKDIGEIGDILNELMQKLEQVNPEELQPEKKHFFMRMFGKISHSVHEILSKYQKTSAQIERISVKLDLAKQTLLRDIQLLEQLYEKNKDYFHALNIYIAAGELKLEELHTKIIPELRKKAETSGDQMAYQEVNDMVQFADRLEKRLHDLKLSRQITIQSAPQIRLIQNTNQTLAEKIQSSIMTAIPLWKNQIAIALTLIRQRHAVEAQKQVSKTTNELLLKNAEMLKANTIETAQENERGLVDIETLKKTQENLISTLEEVLRIQQEGRAKRYQVEQELATMENELKQKLLNLK
ncbi:MAG: toxic anion resistance protein, partial [Bacillales bacterium]|nr:toxic anion resistance protein [Bacillales bacterium]